MKFEVSTAIVLAMLGFGCMDTSCPNPDGEFSGAGDILEKHLYNAALEYGDNLESVSLTCEELCVELMQDQGFDIVKEEVESCQMLLNTNSIPESPGEAVVGTMDECSGLMQKCL